MTNQRQILAAYLEKQFQNQSVDLDEGTITKLGEFIQLEPRPSDTYKETRSIDQMVDSTGKHTAESFKLTNIRQISLDKIFRFLGEGVGAVFFEEIAYKIALGVYMVFWEFYPEVKHKFNEQDSQIIYAISQLSNQEKFHTDDVAASHEQIFESALTRERLDASLDVLVDLGVLRRTAKDTYERKEKIKNLRRVG